MTAVLCGMEATISNRLRTHETYALLALAQYHRAHCHKLRYASPGTHRVATLHSRFSWWGEHMAETCSDSAPVQISCQLRLLRRRRSATAQHHVLHSAELQAHAGLGACTSRRSGTHTGTRASPRSSYLPEPVRPKIPPLARNAAVAVRS